MSPSAAAMAIPVASEAVIQAAVLRYLALDRRVAFAHRINVGATKIQGERGRPDRFVRFAFVGCSDIIGMLRGGHFLAVETKRAKAKPTPEQAEFLGAVTDGGGCAIVARSVDDVVAGLDSFFAKIGAPNDY